MPGGGETESASEREDDMSHHRGTDVLGGWTLDSLSQTNGQAIPRDSSTDLTPGVGQLFLEKARKSVFEALCAIWPVTLLHSALIDQKQPQAACQQRGMLVFP